MASWKEIVSDYIRAKLVTGKIMVGSKARYEQSYSLIDFADDDLINKRALLGISVLPIPIEADITAGDSQPVTIPYSGLMVWPTVIYRNADGSVYSGATSTDDGSNIIVTGDGGATFADSFKVIVKA